MIPCGQKYIRQQVSKLSLLQVYSLILFAQFPNIPSTGHKVSMAYKNEFITRMILNPNKALKKQSINHFIYNFSLQ